MAEMTDDGTATGDGVSVLLGLEPASTQKAGENPPPSEDSNQRTSATPLLGTIFFP